MGKRGWTVSNRPDDDCVDALLALMRTEQAKARYKRRAPIAEFSNVSIKTKLNWARLRSRCVKRGGSESDMARAYQRPPALLRRHARRGASGLKPSCTLTLQVGTDRCILAAAISAIHILA